MIIFKIGFIVLIVIAILYAEIKHRQRNKQIEKENTEWLDSLLRQQVDRLQRLEDFEAMETHND